MKLPLPFLLLLSGLFLCQKNVAQHPFDIDIHVDPLILPLNSVTFVEDGPGYYDINGRVKVAQAIGADFTYWPVKSFGISAGVGVRNFKTQIDYEIPDPLHENAGTILEGSYPFRATGYGPHLALKWRNEKWQASIGYGYFDLNDAQYDSRSGTSGVTIWDEFGVVLVDIEAEEEAYWSGAPNTYKFLQVDVQYYFSKYLFVKIGFENTGKSYWSPYTLKISGYIKDVTPQAQVFNDYKMKAQLASFSIGAGYTLGFGKYKKKNFNWSGN